MTDSVSMLSIRPARHAHRGAGRRARPRPRQALVGPGCLGDPDRYSNFNCGFWGSNGIAAEQGLTTPDIEEAQVKRISMRHTAKRFVISDASNRHGGARQACGLAMQRSSLRGRGTRQVPVDGQRHHGLATDKATTTVTGQEPLWWIHRKAVMSILGALLFLLVHRFCLSL